MRVAPPHPNKFSGRDIWYRLPRCRWPLPLCGSPDHSERQSSKVYRHSLQCRWIPAAAQPGLPRARGDYLHTRKDRTTPGSTKSALANTFLNMGFAATGHDDYRHVSTTLRSLLFFTRAQRHKIDSLDNFSFVTLMGAGHHLQVLDLPAHRYDHSTAGRQLQ